MNKEPVKQEEQLPKRAIDYPLVYQLEQEERTMGVSISYNMKMICLIKKLYGKNKVMRMLKNKTYTTIICSDALDYVEGLLKKEA